MVTWGPFNQLGLTLISAGISNRMPKKVWGEITYPFPTSTVAPLKFGNGEVISFHTLQWINFLINDGIKVKPCYHTRGLYITLVGGELTISAKASSNDKIHKHLCIDNNVRNIVIVDNELRHLWFEIMSWRLIWLQVGGNFCSLNNISVV